MSVPEMFLDELKDFTRLRVAPELRLREHEDAIDGHLEHAARRLHQLDAGVRISLFDVGRQTGSPRSVPSHTAVLDRHLHCSPRGSISDRPLAFSIRRM